MDEQGTSSCVLTFVSNGLMNLTYSYQATAGQSGTGSTAGNSGQLMSISGTINSTIESAAYTYDDLSRLITSNQTSNGSSAQRRFAYDRWGNRTGMWDATSGGTQLQSITLQQSEAVPTNEIASVTAGGVTKTYSYDANGNVTNDGVHTYSYDAENRLKEVDDGATAAFAYDYKNRRIKKVVTGSSTHYVWEGNQMIAEHDATTGAVIYNYVYMGSRLIARMGGGAINWYLNDRLSERLVLDGNGGVIGRMSHLPFGEDFGESGTQEKHHFTTYERDSESGIDYAMNRTLAKDLGRFNQVDFSAGSVGSPQNSNRYTYVANDAVNNIDPYGLDIIPLPGGGIAFYSCFGESCDWELVEPPNRHPLPCPSVKQWLDTLKQMVDNIESYSGSIESTFTQLITGRGGEVEPVGDAILTDLNELIFRYVHNRDQYAAPSAQIRDDFRRAGQRMVDYLTPPPGTRPHNLANIDNIGENAAFGAMQMSEMNAQIRLISKCPLTASQRQEFDKLRKKANLFGETFLPLFIALRRLSPWVRV